MAKGTVSDLAREFNIKFIPVWYIELLEFDLNRWIVLYRDDRFASLSKAKRDWLKRDYFSRKETPLSE